MGRALFIAEFDDPHVVGLGNKLATDGLECFVWDTSRIHKDLPLHVDQRGSLYLRAVDFDGNIRTINGLTKRDAVILRRLPAPEQQEGPNQKAMERSFTHFIQGVVLQICAQSTMVPKFNSALVCERKLFQLHAARQTNLLIPETVIGNDAAAARELSRAGEEICFKPLKAEGWISANGRPAMMPTRTIAASQLEDGPVRRFPGIFQQVIYKEAEVRAVISRDTFIATRFDLVDKIPKGVDLDWRTLCSGEMINSNIDIPNDVVTGARYLLNLLDLDFGIFDFCILGGRWYFLEVNPFGNFLGMNEEADKKGINLIAHCVKERLMCSTQ